MNAATVIPVFGQKNGKATEPIDPNAGKPMSEEEKRVLFGAKPD